MKKFTKLLSIICALALIVSCVSVVFGASTLGTEVDYLSDKTIPADLGTNHFVGSSVIITETGKSAYSGNNATLWKTATTATEETPAAQTFFGASSSDTILTEENNALGEIQTDYYLQMTVTLPEAINNPTTFHIASNLKAKTNGQFPDYYEIFASNYKSDLYEAENSIGILETTDTTTRQHKVDISGRNLPEVKYFGIRFYHRPYSNYGVQISSIGLYGGKKVVKGDVDGDDDCDTADLANLKLLLAEIKEVGDKDIVHPDVNTDGLVNTTDLEQLRIMLSGGEIDDTLKILAIGNSFSVDAMQHLYGILEDGGIQKYVLGNLYIGGCSIETHVSNLDTQATAYKYYKNTDGVWNGYKDFSANEALAEEDWDIISIQQASAKSGRPNSYDDLEALINHIKAVQPNAEIVWHMTWAYAQDSDSTAFAGYDNDQMTMYNAIVDCVENIIVPNDSISKIMPVGTAIQNLRTSYLGDTLNRDGNHLSAGTGRYTAALTWYSVLTGNSIDNISFVPSEFPEIEAQLPAIKDAVNKATANPFKVTESAYKAQE